MKRTIFPASASLLLGCLQLGASSFTTVDTSSYVNGNVEYNAQTFPTGTTTGNQNTGIPFDIASFQGIAGNWSPYHLPTQTLDVPVDVSGQASFYALLNNIYGTPGADEYNITIKATDGDSVTYQSIGGVNTRDYNSNVFTNTIADTTFPWFSNGIGQRLDVREFDLPASFANETISDFIITQVDIPDAVLFSGLTFSDVSYESATPTPEPSCIMLLGAGVGALCLFIRGQVRRKLLGQ